jgi:hypothetical protein
MSALLRRGIAAVLFVTTACTDVAVVTNPMPAGPPLTTSIAPAPVEGDPEPQWPTAIHELTGEMILPANDEQYPARAIVGGFMRYDSYHARLTAHATVTGENNQSYDFYPEERHQFWDFFNLGMQAQWNMYIGGPCGNVVELHLLGEVWWTYDSGWSIDRNERTKNETLRQANCPEEIPGGGVKDPGSDGFYRCYTYTVDHYWYYPDTGVYEYRYTTEQTWCEYNEY